MAADTQKPRLIKTGDADEEKAMFRENYSEYLKREKLYKKNKRSLFALIHGQCTPTLLASVKSQQNYTENFKKKDVLWLIETVKMLSVGIDDNANDLLTD